jgi:hypothetical protein
VSTGSSSGRWANCGRRCRIQPRGLVCSRSTRPPPATHGSSSRRSTRASRRARTGARGARGHVLPRRGALARPQNNTIGVPVCRFRRTRRPAST